MMADVGLVVVSHSAALAEAARDLAAQMVRCDDARIVLAAGMADGSPGTDAARIADAVTRADRGDGVVVLMDLGSAVLSAQLSLEFLDGELGDRVVLCPAPIVEGLIVAAVAAAGGAGRDEVAREASAALSAKVVALAPESETTVPRATPASPDAATATFTVTNEHGLHARPAARLVAAAAAEQADLELRNESTGSPWVSAASLTQVAILGVRRGHQVSVRAHGRNADVAIQTVLGLVERGFDESAPYPVSPGTGHGPARVLRPAPRTVPGRQSHDAAAENHRLDEAIESVRREVAALRDRAIPSLGNAAKIFDAHLLMLDDRPLLDRARDLIMQRHNAATAWEQATGDLLRKFEALADPYQQARSGDVAGLADLVLRALAGVPLLEVPHSGVLIAADLAPAEAAAAAIHRVAAVLLAAGNPLAHAAILLRAGKIPAVFGAGAAVLEIADGTLVEVDGTRGTFTVA